MKYILKRRILLISLLLVLVIPPFITFWWLHHQKDLVRKQVKHKIIQGIDRQELVLLSFTKQDIQEKLDWEHSKEFEYQGQMYDIVETIIAGDTIHYWCWWDHQETKLNKKLSLLTQRAFAKNPKQKEKKQHLSRYLQSLFFEKTSITIKANDLTITGHSCFYSFIYQSVNISPPTPPPCIS